MASEDEANKARQQHGRDLLKMGAHAIGVEEGKRHGKSGWVVVAHVEPNAKVAMPSMLSANDGEVEVPLVIARSEPYKPE